MKKPITKNYKFRGIIYKSATELCKAMDWKIKSTYVWISKRVTPDGERITVITKVQ